MRSPAPVVSTTSGGGTPARSPNHLASTRSPVRPRRSPPHPGPGNVPLINCGCAEPKNQIASYEDLLPCSSSGRMAATADGDDLRTDQLDIPESSASSHRGQSPCPPGMAYRRNKQRPRQVRPAEACRSTAIEPGARGPAPEPGPRNQPLYPRQNLETAVRHPWNDAPEQCDWDARHRAATAKYPDHAQKTNLKTPPQRRPAPIDRQRPPACPSGPSHRPRSLAPSIVHWQLLRRSPPGTG